MADVKESKFPDEVEMRRDAAARAMCVDRNRPENVSRWSEEERDYEFILKHLLAVEIMSKKSPKKASPVRRDSPSPVRDVSPVAPRRVRRPKAGSISQDTDEDAVIVRSQPLRVPERKK